MTEVRRDSAPPRSRHQTYYRSRVRGATGVKAVAAGASHSLALKGDGTVWAWGANDGGQLGNNCRRGRPRLATGPDQPQPDRVHLEATRNADRPGKVASREPLTKRRAQPVTGIRQPTADAQVGCDHAINLGERDLRLGACRSTFERNVRPLKPRLIARPTLGKKEAQTPESSALPRASVNDQGLATSVLAKCHDTDRVLALLRRRSVVDHQHCIAATNKPVRLNELSVPSSLGCACIRYFSVFLCGVDHRQDTRYLARIKHPCFKEVRCVWVG
jgi:hypothetical protein